MNKVAVYSKKDYENFINRDKIRKKKIKKRIYNTITIFVVLAIIAGEVVLFSQDKTNYIKEDNYTYAINYAIDRFVNEKPVSHDDFPRLTYDFYSLPPILPNNPVDDNTIHKDYTTEENTESTDENSNIEQTDNKENNNDNKVEDNKNEDAEDKEKPDYIIEEEKETYFEYDHFIEIAGKGNYPGCGITGPNFIKEIRAELCLAIKAYTTMPLDTNIKEREYRIDYKDDTYDYVYFFLAGEAKKVDKNYLKKLDETATNKNVFSIYNFWISLTEDKSSQLAKVLLNQSNEGIFSVVISDPSGKTLNNVKVSFISGSYIETFTTSQDSVIIFDGVPFGMAEIRVEKEGYIDFPHEEAYKNYEQINIVNDVEYYGKNVTNPLRIKLLASSAAKCTFSYTTLHYEYGVDGYKPTLEVVGGNFNVTLRNKETKEEINRVVNYDGDYFYWFEFFENVKAGEYDIDIYPTNITFKPLYLKNMYINEHGISADGYLKENEDYTFAFNKDEMVNVAFEIIDGTNYGLNSPKGQLDMYQLIQTNVLKKDGWVELKLVDKDGKTSTAKLVQNEKGVFVGNIDVLQNKEYNVYVSTIYGDVLLYKNINLKTNNYLFSATISDQMLPKCIVDISVKHNAGSSGEIVNVTNDSERFILENDGHNTLLYKTEIPLKSGLYYLNIKDAGGNVIETYLILISNKSNHYALTFN